MRRAFVPRGFSLVEVVIAVGVFAVAVTAILAVLPSVTRQNAEFADRMVAQRLPAALHTELARLAATSGYDVLATSVPVMTTSLDAGLSFVATRDGSSLGAISSSGADIPVDERYFQIETWRFDRVPLTYDASGAVLALFVRVTWPYRLPGSADATPLRSRNELTFTTALNR